METTKILIRINGSEWQEMTAINGTINLTIARKKCRDFFAKAKLRKQINTIAASGIINASLNN